MKTSFEMHGDEVILKINKNIYPKEVILQATYVKLDEFYFLIDEDENYFLVSIKYKEESGDLERAAYEFFDELIESASYLDQLKRTSELRQTILERALLTQSLDEEMFEKREE